MKKFAPILFFLLGIELAYFCNAFAYITRDIVSSLTKEFTHGIVHDTDETVPVGHLFAIDGGSHYLDIDANGNNLKIDGY